MQELFKNLRNQQKGEASKSFADALFGGRPYFLGPAPKVALEVVTPPPKKVETSPPGPSIESEKTRTLQALEKFTLEKKEGQGSPVVKFSGGELAAKSSGREIVVSLKNPAPRSWEDIQETELLTPLQSADLFFLGEYDTQEQGQLLTNMIAAMKLVDYPAARFPLPKDELDSDYWSERIAAHLYLLKPQVLVSLGAQATNLISRKKERLTQVHGKFVTLKFLFSDEKSVSVQLFPIFHPEFLIINPNMKRTAWIDLQKIMEFFSKSS